MIYLRMIRSMCGISVSLATRRRERSPPGKPARRGRILASRPSLPIDGGDSPPWLSFRRDGLGTACFPGRSHRKKGGRRTLPASKARDSGGGREPGFPPTRLAAVAPPRCGALASIWESPLREPRENSRGGGVSAEGFRPASGSRAGISAKFDKYEQIKTNSQLFPTLFPPFCDLFDRPLSHPVSPPFPHRRAHHPHQKYIPPGARPRTANAG